MSAGETRGVLVDVGDVAARASGSSARVVLHTASLAAISFVMSANGNALPQLFYQRFHAHDKVLLLGACLFVGTCGSIAGVMASRGGAPRARRVLSVLAAMFAIEGALLLVSDAIAYAALTAGAQLCANYAMNRLDHAASARAGDRHRRLHDAASNAVRLLGMLAAPALFTALHARRAALWLLLAGAAAVALTSASSLFSRGASSDEGAPRALGDAPVDLADRLVFGFAVSVYVALYLFAANLIYLLRDVVGVTNAEPRGGLAIVVVFVAALAANAGAGLLRREARSPRRALLALAAPLPALAISSAMIARGAGLPFEAVLAGCALVGLAYGAFLAEIRDYASRGMREHGKSALLSMFNNMANVSALIAFALMIVIAASARDDQRRVYALVLTLVGALPIAGLPLLVASRAHRAEREGAR